MNASVRREGLADRIDAVLPQTQCGRCGYDGCRPYADAVAGGDALNRCPPGGDAVIAMVAVLAARPVVPLDPAHGAHGPLVIARIDEARCIGCTLCIQACPVDAIVGAAKRMHTVLPALCSGCALCIPPCPVDCIAMIPAGRAWSPEDARAARARFEARNRRLAAPASAGSSTDAPAGPAPVPVATDADRQRRQDDIAAARARARARRQGAPGKMSST